MARTRTIIGFAGTLTAFALALWLLDWDALVVAFANLPAEALALSAVFSLLTTLVLGARWAVLTAPTGQWYGRQRFRDALVGQIYNVLTPAAVGADAYRIVIASHREGGRTRAVAMVFLERIFGLSAFAFAFLLSFIVGINGPASSLLAGAAVIFAGMLLTMLSMLVITRVLVWPGMAITATKRGILLGEIFAQLTIIPLSRLLSALVLTLVGLATWLLCLGIIARANGLLLPSQDIVMIAVVTEFARLLPISIQGIGVREMTFASLAAKAGGAAAPAFAACATAYALHFLLSAVIGLIARTSIDHKLVRRKTDTAAARDSKELSHG